MYALVSIINNTIQYNTIQYIVYGNGALTETYNKDMLLLSINSLKILKYLTINVIKCNVKLLAMLYNYVVFCIGSKLQIKGFLHRAYPFNQ